MIQNIHHIAIISSSEASIDFYAHLGFQETYRRERAYDTIVLLQGYGIQLEMFIDPSHPARATDPENIGIRHLALQVDNIEQTAEELQLEIGPIQMDWVGIRYAYTWDPDGLPVELHE
ncbi:MAG: VOC family protein [Lachnospiraceae bacterium]|nr:VOC family protein [Lachnospiraceae bacterium]